jgi:hypothetical protein
MRYLVGAFLALFLSLGVSGLALAECRGSAFGDYEEYDFGSFGDVENFCNQHARNFEIIRIGKDEPSYDLQSVSGYRKPVQVDHWGQALEYIESKDLGLQDAGFDDYCFYVQRRTSGGWGGNNYSWDARFYYNVANFRGRGQWDIFRSFEEYAWYRTYQGWNFQVRLHFPARCDDY